MRAFDDLERIPGARLVTGEALETDDAAQAGDRELDVVVGSVHGLSGDRVEIKWRQAATHDVDNASAGEGTQVGLAQEVLVAQRRLVAETHSVQLTQAGKDAAALPGSSGTRKSTSSVARTKRLAITAKPPMTTNFAPSATSAEAASSSLGSGRATAPLHRSQKAGGLSREVLAAAQQLADRSVGRRRQGATLFRAKPCPLCLVARLHQRPMRRREHRHQWYLPRRILTRKACAAVWATSRPDMLR